MQTTPHTAVKFLIEFPAALIVTVYGIRLLTLRQSRAVFTITDRPFRRIATVCPLAISTGTVVAEQGRRKRGQARKHNQYEYKSKRAPAHNAIVAFPVIYPRALLMARTVPLGELKARPQGFPLR